LSDEKHYIAVDLGADSGRVMLGTVSSEKLHLHEIHRFVNGPIEQNDSLRWDFPRLLAEIKTGIAKSCKEANGNIAGIGIDSWGVDFGLLDDKGNLIENPYHYRDKRTNGVMDKAFALMPKREIYEQTGIQFMQLNSLFQLLSMRLAGSPVLKKARKMIYIADLVSYYLTGIPYAEYTLASTSQMLDMRTGLWSKSIFDGLDLPISICPDVIRPPKIIGPLTDAVCKEISCPKIPVIAVASHDSANAVAAVPADEISSWAYLSSGTWSVMGVEIPNAIINDKTFKHNFTNEGGIDATIRLLTNIMGLWLVQECKRQWKKQGLDLSYDQLTALAQKAVPFAAFIETNNADFLAPGDMPQRINNYLSQTGQKQISDKGLLTRVILEGLAFKYREVFDQLEDITAKKIDILHIVGGGSRNTLLNQFTANAVNRSVVAGPAEATAIGNLLTQARAVGQITSLAKARRLVKNSFDLKFFQPKDLTLWQKHYNNKLNIASPP
jgi:rhamnulokinase